MADNPTTNFLKNKKPLPLQPNMESFIGSQFEEYDTEIGGESIINITGHGATRTLVRAEMIAPRWAITGTLTSNLTILIDKDAGSQRTPLVINSTTGAFTITFKTTHSNASRRSVTLANSESQRIRHDGEHTDPAGLKFHSSTGSPSSQRGSITGLKLEWVSNNSLRVTTGAAHLESGSILESASAITKSSLSLTIDTWYHAYLYSNAGSADVEVVTTDPATPYFGSARSKTGDTSRRYLGSVRAIATNQMANFQHEGLQILYRERTLVTPFRVLSNGMATSETSVDCSGVIPVTARLAKIRLANLTTNAAIAGVGTADDSIAGGGGTVGGIITLGQNYNVLADVPLSSNRQFTYWFDVAPATNGLFGDVFGYLFER